MLPKMVRPDAKGRITLGHLADGVSGFYMIETSDHKIILEPFIMGSSSDKPPFWEPTA